MLPQIPLPAGKGERYRGQARGLGLSRRSPQVVVAERETALPADHVDHPDRRASPSCARSIGVIVIPLAATERLRSPRVRRDTGLRGKLSSVPGKDGGTRRSRPDRAR